MRIDFHVHVFPDEIAQRAIGKLSQVAGYQSFTDGTLKNTVEILQQNGTDAFVLLNIAQTPTQEEKANDFVCSIKEKNIYPFAALHPFGKWEYQLDKAVDCGLKGVKLHPEYQGFDIDDLSVFKFYEKCFEKNMIVLFHAGYDPAYPFSRRGYPEKAKHVIKAFKGGKIVLAHMGNPLSLDSAEEYLLGSNVYFDLSMAYFNIPANKCAEFIKKHGVDKFLYATDTPWSSSQLTCDYIKAMNFGQQAQDLIFYKNAKTLLNIE